MFPCEKATQVEFIEEKGDDGSPKTVPLNVS